MVNDKGYIKIIDFGTVKEIKERTSTIIGTPHYMAPEIVKGEGYSFQVDIWSIAICLFEFYCGKLPFGEQYDEPMDVYKAVIREEIIFPNFIKDKEFIALINEMLIKNPFHRLCLLEKIKQAPFFKNFPWNKLISLAIKPPHMITFKDDGKDNKGSVPYLNVVKKQAVKGPSVKKDHSAQNEFNKWLSNF